MTLTIPLFLSSYTIKAFNRYWDTVVIHTRPIILGNTDFVMTGYDQENDCYICPEGCTLFHKTTNREGYREYYSDGETCKNCPHRAQCFSEKSTRRLVTRHVWQDYLDDATAFTKTPTGKLLYAWRKETIERSFADAKELHGMRTAKRLGLQNMREQSFLTAAVQNMKKIALVTWRKSSALLRLLFAQQNKSPCFA